MKECAGTCSFEILPYTEGVSTTELIERLLNDEDFGDVANTTEIPTEELSERVRQRSEEFQKTPSIVSVCLALFA